MTKRHLSSRLSLSVLFGILPLGVLACAEEATELEAIDPYATGVDGSATTTVDPKTLTCQGRQVVYTGFTGRDGQPESLVAGREEQPIGMDRARLKPFSALLEDYHRVLGLDWKNDNKQFITVLFGSGATFGEPPARWYSEPAAGAVAFYQGYRAAFEGCGLMLAKDAKYKTAPTEESAAAECATMERKFWSRTPTPEEINECVKVAMVDSLKETTPTGTTDTVPMRRWTYACASVMTSAGFISY